MRILTLALVIFSFVSLSAFAESEQYTCAMHPHYIAEEPGNCPVCGMELIPLGGEEEEEEQISVNTSQVTPSSSKKEILYWVAPMNPNYKMDKPGKSPMGMDLVPVYADADSGQPTKKNARKVITISPETIQNMGVRTEKAEITRFGTDIRSYGLVIENVRLKQDISSRIAGWVEDLEITAVGDEVKKGDLLFTLYSPELLSAQQDYLAAISAGIKGRITSSARRLKSLGVQKIYLDNLKQNRKTRQNVPFYAETDGIISMLMVAQGSYVKPGMQIATVQDYSNVWINVSIAEKDLQFLNKKTEVTVVFPNLGGLERIAKIDYIYPTIDIASRTGQIRLVLDNTDGSLKPGSYADVVFESGIDKRLAIPFEAILKSKDGDYVVVSLGNGRFQSQKVKTGVVTKDRIEILKGLSEGEDVVVSSQFLIDSESALRESFRKLKNAQKPLSELNVTNDQLVMINHLVDTALYIHEVLTTETDFSSSLVMPSLKLNDHLIPKFRGTKLQFILEDAEKAILKAKESITDSQLRTALAELLEALKPWLLNGKPDYYKDKGLNLFMDHGQKRLWIQMEKTPSNPYGEGMSMPQQWSATQMNNMMLVEGAYYA